MNQAITEFAANYNVEASSVQWLAEYIIRQTPEGHEDLLADTDWIAACVEEWRRMQRHMAVTAIRRIDQTAPMILNMVRH